MIYDLAIIGGGPAGLMAASRAGELGAKVIIIEKNHQLGVKLLMTGNGRCNITNKIDDHKILAGYYGVNGKFLLSGLSKFDANDTINFFTELGVKTKIEDNNRVLPKSDKARDVLNAFLNNFKKYQTVIKTDSAVAQIISENNHIKKIILNTGEEIVAKSYLLATGGKSYPKTGSTGDAYKWLKQFGHTLIEPHPALMSINLKEKYIAILEGVSFKDVELSVWHINQLIAKEQGDIIFTSSGISGPATINLSRKITDKKSNNAKLSIDFFPAKTEKQLDNDLQSSWAEQKNKTIKNALSILTSTKLTDIILNLSKIDSNKQVNSITRDERKMIVANLKEFHLTISELGSFETAMVTKGGVKLSEVDPKTMHSKIIDNLCFAGELLDLDGPTGGFNLQVCWTTGYVAGENAI